MKISRRGLLSAASVLALSKTAFARSVRGGGPGSVITSLRRMQIGLDGINYFQGFSPLMNWWLIGSQPSVYKADNTQQFGSSLYDNSNASGSPLLDPATMEPALPINPTYFNRMTKLLFQAPSGASNVIAQAGGYTTRTMVAYCHSDWTITVSTLGTGGSVTSGNGTNLVNFIMGAGGDCAPQIAVAPVGTPTHVPAVKICYAANKTLLDAGGVFDPNWLSIVSQFGAIRLMDFNAINGSTMTSDSYIAPETYQAWGAPYNQTAGTASDFGFVGGFPLTAAAKLANQADVELHYCIPAMASNAMIDAIATALKAGTAKKISFELGNECSWRSGVNNIANDYFAAQALLVPGDPWSAVDAGTRATYYYGYRASEMMKRISDIYADRTRWRGGLATQSVFPAVTDNILIGVDYWLTNVGGSAPRSTYFNDIFGTCYMGPAFGWFYPTGCTKANPGVVTAVGSGVTNGQRLKFFVAGGMTQLNNLTVTATVIDADHFSIGVNTTGFSTWSPGVPDAGNTCWSDGVLWDMMDNSAALNISNPATYPTKYTYFNQQLRDAITNGTCAAGYTVATVYSTVGQADPTVGSWKLQADKAASFSGQFRLYEGGPNWFAGPALNNSQYNEFALAWHWSAECGQMMTAAYTAYSAYGDRASHFTEAGQIDGKVPWPGMRAMPQDTANGLWSAITTWNRG